MFHSCSQGKSEISLRWSLIYSTEEASCDSIGSPSGDPIHEVPWMLLRDSSEGPHGDSLLRGSSEYSQEALVRASSSGRLLIHTCTVEKSYLVLLADLFIHTICFRELARILVMIRRGLFIHNILSHTPHAVFRGLLRWPPTCSPLSEVSLKYVFVAWRCFVFTLGSSFDPPPRRCLMDPSIAP